MYPNTRLPSKCQKAYDKNGMRGLALLVIEELLEYYNPLPMPTNEPQQLIAYRMMDFDDKKKWDKDRPNWREHQDVKEFIYRKEFAIRENDSRRSKLCDFLPHTDGMNKQKILNKITEFDLDPQTKP